jgi:hypothetical protein
MQLSDIFNSSVSAQYNVTMDDDGTPLLSGFEQSRFIYHRGFIEFAGSARYMAPELAVLEPDAVYGEDEDETYENQDTRTLTKDTDIYAFSMLALEVSNLLCV